MISMENTFSDPRICSMSANGNAFFVPKKNWYKKGPTIEAAVNFLKWSHQKILDFVFDIQIFIRSLLVKKNAYMNLVISFCPS